MHATKHETRAKGNDLLGTTVRYIVFQSFYLSVRFTKENRPLSIQGCSIKQPVVLVPLSCTNNWNDTFISDTVKSTGKLFL